MPFMSDSDPNSVYDRTHRAFLQAILSRQSITYEESKPILAAIQTAATPDRPTLDNDVTQEDFETYIQTISDQISSFDYEIRSTIHQTSRERIYSLVNTTSDALTQLATTHSADEIAYVKRVLDVMFDENNTARHEIMAVSSNRALKCYKPPREEGQTQTQSAANSGLTMTQAEKLLYSLVQEGWFEYNDESHMYSLSPRSLMELRTWLVDAYNEPAAAENEDEDDDEEARHQKIKFCAACRDIVTVGQRCPDFECVVRLHEHCMRNYFRAQAGREQCAVCKTEWKDAGFVGERAVEQRHQQNGRRRGGGSSNGAASTAGASRRSAGTRRSQSVAPTEIEDDEEDEEEDMEE